MVLQQLRLNSCARITVLSFLHFPLHSSIPFLLCYFPSFTLFSSILSAQPCFSLFFLPALLLLPPFPLILSFFSIFPPYFLPFNHSSSFASLSFSFILSFIPACSHEEHQQSSISLCTCEITDSAFYFQISKRLHKSLF